MAKEPKKDNRFSFRLYNQKEVERAKACFENHSKSYASWSDYLAHAFLLGLDILENKVSTDDQKFLEYSAIRESQDKTNLYLEQVIAELRKLGDSYYLRSNIAQDLLCGIHHMADELCFNGIEEYDGTHKMRLPNEIHSKYSDQLRSKDGG
jgi:hypothetical protein